MRNIKIAIRSGLEYEKDENNKKVWIFLDKCESYALRKRNWLISWLCTVSISVEIPNTYYNNNKKLRSFRSTYLQMLMRHKFGCKTYPQLKLCHGLWCKKCVKSGEPSSWETAARVWVHQDLRIANNLKCVIVECLHVCGAKSMSSLGNHHP